MTTSIRPATVRRRSDTASGRMVPRIYRATTTHRRTTAAPTGIARRFTYRTCYWLIDLDTPPELPRWLRRLVRFEARDHVGDATSTLAGNAREVLAAHHLTADRILLLTCPRTFGHVFNPLSVYYCLRDIEPDGDELVAVIAEVHNTYRGRHVYVLRPDAAGSDRVDKRFYVSPFLPMGGTYTMRTPLPGERLSVAVTLRQGGATSFVATLTGPGRGLTIRSAIGALLRWPLLTLRTSALIRWQGIRLWLRGVPVRPRPVDASADERGR